MKNIKSRLKNFLWNVKFEITWHWNEWIIRPVNNFRVGIMNLVRWRKIIYRDRWWDYGYLLDVIEFKLNEMLQHWGYDTHYENDKVDRDILRSLLEDLRYVRELEEKNDLEAAKKARINFFTRLGRHLDKFWD